MASFAAVAGPVPWLAVELASRTRAVVDAVAGVLGAAVDVVGPSAAAAAVATQPALLLWLASSSAEWQEGVWPSGVEVVGGHTGGAGQGWSQTAGA